MSSLPNLTQVHDWSLFKPQSQCYCVEIALLYDGYSLERSFPIWGPRSHPSSAISFLPLKRRLSTTFPLNAGSISLCQPHLSSIAVPPRENHPPLEPSVSGFHHAGSHLFFIKPWPNPCPRAVPAAPPQKIKKNFPSSPGLPFNPDRGIVDNTRSPMTRGALQH